MSLTTAITSAFSGLQATQAAMDVVSQNVSNSGTVGYTRRVLGTEQQVSGDQTTGVNITGAQRMLDTLVQRQLRLETSGAAYTGVKASYHASLDAMFDAPGSSGSLSTLANGLTSSLTALVNDPSSYSNRTGVLSAASALASTLNGLTTQVQGLRGNAEAAIGQDVSQANDLLTQIADVSKAMTGSESQSSPALQDKRDGLIDQLSKLMDVRVTPGTAGSVSLSTTGGLQLFDGVRATTLSFDARAPIVAQSQYSSDPAKRSVGTIKATFPSGGTSDVLQTGAIRSGEIGALVELRDTTLPTAQTQLDTLAAGLATALSNKTVAGVAATGSGGATGFSIDTSALQSGNAVTLDITDAAGSPQRITFVRADDPSVTSLPTSAVTNGSTRVVPISFTGGTSVASQIQTALGATTDFAVSSPSGSTIQILNGGTAGTTTVKALSADVTVTGLKSGDAQLPLFVDGGRGNVPYTGSFDGGSELTGFAGRIVINPGAKSDPSTMTLYGSTTPAGDPTRPQALLDAMNSTSRRFPAAAAIGGSATPYTGTVADFASRIIETQANDANAASSLDDGQNVALNAVQSRYSDLSGVSIDQEMTQLIQLQTAYGANARIMSAAKDMFDTLLRVGA